jgi:hypothetical protein
MIRADHLVYSSIYVDRNMTLASSSSVAEGLALWAIISDADHGLRVNKAGSSFSGKTSFSSKILTKEFLKT